MTPMVQVKPQQHSALGMPSDLVQQKDFAA